MMKTTYQLAEISRTDAGTFGGKAAALRGLQEAGIHVPATLCIATDAYKHFVSQSGLREKIELELHRKNFSDMRWEEIWDTALRIRSLFLRYSMPEKLAREISGSMAENFDDQPTVVRSSAPEEDAAATSPVADSVDDTEIQEAQEKSAPLAGADEEILPSYQQRMYRKDI